MSKPKKPASIKKLLLVTAIWFVVMIGGGLLVMFLTIDKSAPNRVTQAKVEKLGTGIGTLTGIGAAVIWLPFAYRKGKEKREEAERKKVAQQKRPRK